MVLSIFLEHSCTQISMKLYPNNTPKKHAHVLLQEMQLFTADVDTKLMTLGLRTSANEAGTCKALSCSSLHEQASRRIAGQGKSSSRSPEQDNHNHVGNRTHCSTSNLLSQSLMQGTNSGTSSPGRTAAAGACEMTADSKEVKEESSMNGLDSPRSSLIKDALRLGPGKSTLPPHSGDLQERDSGGSNGSADVPANTAVAGQLVHVGGCLQLQTHIASQDVQLLSPASSVRWVFLLLTIDCSGATLAGLTACQSEQGNYVTSMPGGIMVSNWMWFCHERFFYLSAGE